MPERITVPFKYIGDVGKCSLMPVGEELTSLQQFSKAALETIPRFRKLTAVNQDICLQTLSVLGAYTISICDGKWNSSRWYETWEKLNSDAIVVINAGTRVSSEATIKNGFMNLFQMLECGARTRQELSRVKSLNKGELPDGSTAAITSSVQQGLIIAHKHGQRARNKAV